MFSALLPAGNPSSGLGDFIQYTITSGSTSIEFKFTGPAKWQADSRYPQPLEDLHARINRFKIHSNTPEEASRSLGKEPGNTSKKMGQYCKSTCPDPGALPECKEPFFNESYQSTGGAHAKTEGSPFHLADQLVNQDNNYFGK